MSTHNLVFMPSGRRGIVEEGTTLQTAARSLGEGIETICGGKASCGKCKVRILEGTQNNINSSMAHLLPIAGDEKQYLDQYGLQPDERLACQARVCGDLVVFVPEESRLGQQSILKTASDRSIDIIPSIRNYYIELPSTDLNNALLAKKLEHRFGLVNIVVDPKALQSLSDVSTNSQGITVTVWNEHEVIRIQPGNVDKAYGMAVDIGTTTIGSYLCDLASGEIVATAAMMNPQIRFGEDIMTRIAYAKANPNGLTELNQTVIEALNELARTITAQAGLIPDDIVEVVAVGNTTMHHIFLKLDVVPLGTWPFTPAVEHSINVKARDLKLGILPSANIHVLPIEAGFVGADNVGVLIAEEPYNQDEILLIIDIGTNGELVLGNRDRLLSASCATGPAFEGASIRFGMRAATGAIAKVRIDPQTLEVRFNVIGKTQWNTELQLEEIQARGICGSGIIDAVAEMLVSGIIKKNGAFDKTVASPNLRLDQEGKPEFVIAGAKETAIDQDIVITQQDIRAIQLAKAAIYSGTQLMLRRLGFDRPDKVILAGAFGTVIDQQRAMTIGMFPKVGLKDVYAVGNAAGDGARIALLNKTKRAEADRIAREVEYIELTAEPGFEETFIAATHFPDAAESLS